MSTSEEETSSQEVSEDTTSADASTESPAVESSEDDSSNLLSDSDSAGNDILATGVGAMVITSPPRGKDDDSSSAPQDSSSESESHAKAKARKEKKKKKRRRGSRRPSGYKSGKKPSRHKRYRNAAASSTTDETGSPLTSGDDSTEKSTSDDQYSSASETGTPSSTAAADPSWSVSEDFILLNMRKDARKPSWDEIAHVLHKSKRDVKARWGLLQNTEQQGSQDQTTSESEPHERSSNDKRPRRKHKRGSRGRGRRRRSLKQTTFPSDEETRRADVTYDPSPSGHAPSRPPSPSSSSGDDSLTYAASDPEVRRQKKYLQKHIRAQLFPPDKYPTADETFSQADCEVLASVESQYKRSKWLEMQANFYNVTGRLVPIEMIRARCEREDGAGF